MGNKMSEDSYCQKCGHYVAIPYMNTECECDCHEDKPMFYGDSRDDIKIEKN